MALPPTGFRLRADGQSTPLFKFTEAQYAHAMVDRGSIRIGTLFDFRNQQAHRYSIGDWQEGDPHALAIFDHLELRPGEPPPPFLGGVFEPDPGGPTTFEQLVVEKRGTDQDFFVVCVSAEYSTTLLTQAGYDACVRINNPRGFFQALTNAIEDRVSEWSVHPCTYGVRHGPYGPAHDTPTVWVKDARFGGQSEVRAVWTPKAYPIQPFSIEIPDIRPFLRIEAIP